MGVSGMGVAVAKLALLVRVDNSPYQAGGAPWYVSEFWGPSVYEMSNFTTVLGSRAVSMVPFQFMSVLSGLAAHSANRMGSWRFPGRSDHVRRESSGGWRRRVCAGLSSVKS